MFPSELRLRVGGASLDLWLVSGNKEADLAEAQPTFFSARGPDDAPGGPRTRSQNAVKANFSIQDKNCCSRRPRDGTEAVRSPRSSPILPVQAGPSGSMGVMLQVSSVLGNGQRLDGGAMFGNAPRALWSGWCPPDSQGRVELACRCFLVEDGARRILLETGVGAFFPPELKARYGVVEDSHVLLESLSARGLSAQDIDVVVLSHLHFDHAGGLLRASAPGSEPALAFPRAAVLVGESAWARAQHPHVRDRASFIADLVPLLRDCGRLVVVPDAERRHPVLGDRIELLGSHGHTPGMRLALLRGAVSNALFCADLVPGVPWVHAPLTMGYDRFPELLIDEKVETYGALGLGTRLLFTHDLHTASARLCRDGSGRFAAEDRLPVLDRLDLDVV